MRFSRLLGGLETERQLDAPKSTAVLYASDVLTSSEDNLSKKLRGQDLGASFGFIYKVSAKEVLELRFVSLRMGALSAEILVFLKGVTWAVNCDLLINCSAVRSSEN